MTDWRLKRAKDWFAPQLRDLALEQMERLVAQGVFQIRGELASIEEGLADRFQLDLQRDPNDPLCVSLSHAFRGTGDVVDACRKLMGQQDEIEPVEFTRINLNDIVSSCVEKFYPGIVSRQIEIHWKPLDVPSEVTTIKPVIIDIR